MNDTLFDNWAGKYDGWFDTPTGRLVKDYEAELLLELLAPRSGEKILDAGCGSGIFTGDVLAGGAAVMGVDISAPMLQKALTRLGKVPFTGLCADLCALPFADNSFDKVFSMTAIEFVADAKKAIGELHRVARPGGCVVVTTLNSRSPWASRRKEKAKEGHSLFEHIHFRSPDDMRALVSRPCMVATAIHFLKSSPLEEIPELERRGREETPATGAFLAVRWEKC